MEKKWEEMSAKEKRDARFADWASPKLPDGNDLPFQSPEAKAEYKARVQRYKDIIELKKPDRVPIMLMATFMPSYLGGALPRDVMYDTEKLKSSFTKFMVDYKPDYYITPAFAGNGKIFEILGYKLLKWPGHGISKDSTGYQYTEGEYMLPEDYPALIEDPSDFWLRTYMPRAFGALEPLKMISPFTNQWEPVMVGPSVIPFGIPPVQDALKALINAGNEAMAWIQQIGGIEGGLMSMGFVNGAGGATKAPFDYLADTLRGSRGIMVDMYRRPEMVLKAMERIIPIAVKSGAGGATMQRNPVVFLPLHRGADGFMSDEQFRKFYWPYLKEVLVGLINEGCVPALFCEGSYNTRLEYLKELPKASTLWIFDRSDMARIKKLLGNTICIGGNVPAGLIAAGTAGEVKAYCKNLIDVVGKGGGYMMANGTSMDDGKPEAVHAMIDFTKEYGVYK
jgi:hypothetical protein